MSLTLDMQNELIREPLRKGVIKTYTESSDILKFMPFINVAGNSYTYNRQDTGALRVFCKPSCLLPCHIFCKDIIKGAVHNSTTKLEHVIAIGNKPPGS